MGEVQQYEPLSVFTYFTHAAVQMYYLSNLRVTVFTIVDINNNTIRLFTANL
jgi:hypothetical protein